VAAFYRAWAGEQRSATEQELAQAGDLITRYGADGALGLVGPIAALLRSKFQSAKRFGAAIGYFEEAARARRTAVNADVEAARRGAERDDAARRCAEEDALLITWGPVWDALSEQEREAIRAVVLEEHPYQVRPLLRQSRLAARLSLEELARRSALDRRP
jgi:hypothetical protein